MATMTLPQTTEIEESFPPGVCPICAYSLEGLPGLGNCPECGNLYDSTELILHGWARGSHATPTNSRGLGLLFSTIPGVALINILPQWLMGQLSNRFALIFLAGWAAIIGFALLRRTQVDHPGGVQLRMNRRGIVQIDNVINLRHKPENAAVPRNRWGELGIAKLESPKANLLRLKLELQSRSRRVLFFIRQQEIPVDAEVACPRGDATEVGVMIRSWLAADGKYLSDLRAELNKGVL